MLRHHDFFSFFSKTVCACVCWVVIGNIPVCPSHSSTQRFNIRPCQWYCWGAALWPLVLFFNAIHSQLETERMTVSVCAHACVCGGVYVHVWNLKKKRERKGKEMWYCALCKSTADSAHEDVWEHWALGSRNVWQTDIKDIRYGTPLCFTLLLTCPGDINCGPGRTPHSQELSSKETPGTGVLSIKYKLIDD